MRSCKNIGRKFHLNFVKATFMAPPVLANPTVPGKRRAVSSAKIYPWELMVRWLVGLGFVFWALAAGASSAGSPPNVFESPEAPVAKSKLDKIVFAQLTRREIEPVLCSDAVFVRRVYLDVIGTLPTAQGV